MPSWPISLYNRAAERIDRRVGWDKLPKPIAMLVLIGLRNILREKNLYDTGRGPLDQPDISAHPRHLTARTLDGTFNNLDDPLMGSLGSRFGRNVPLETTVREQDPLQPNPRTVSRELLTRHEFIPATTLNLLAGAWIQFEVHDWFSHGKNETANPWLVPLADDDPWPEHPMPIPRTRSDPSAAADGPPTFVTDDTHWWDGSQVYGRDPAFAAAMRTGEHGKLKLDAQGLIPQEIESHVDLTGVAGNFWVGLALLHSLFMREHNAVCDHLQATHPELSDDELFDKARLVVAALMAKIHTVDWTPAIIAHPTTVTALRTNWWGLEGRRLDRLIGRRTSNEVIRGIPGSPTDLHGVPFQLTEEFVAVYRMHPLIPDEFSFRSLADDATLQELHAAGDRCPACARTADRDVDGRCPLLVRDDASGRDHAAQLPALPAALRPRRRHRSSTSPRSTSLRVRERGVPRYNEFRRLLHLKAYDTFEEMADTPEHAADLRRVYSDPEEVDTMIGMYAEQKPKGFGFSDTAFRIFILMASRRLESDRFFTSDYRPEIYTKEGIDWVEDNSMKTLLLRHFPELEPSLRGVDNPFAPWPRARA